MLTVNMRVQRINSLKLSANTFYLVFNHTLFSTMKNVPRIKILYQIMPHLLAVLAYFFLVIVGTSSSAIAQNDTVLPTYEAEYNLYRMTFDSNMDWVYTQETYSLANYDLDDSLEVYGSWLNSTPLAKIFFGDSVAYILATPYGAGQFHHVYQDSVVALYDFTLSPGDTGYFDTSNQDFPVIVESVSYITIDGQLRKKLIFDNSEVWIQGVGSLTHPLWPVMNHFEINYIFCSMSGMYMDFTNIYHEETDCSGFGSIGLEENKPISGKVVKTVDLLGRETSDGSNQVLFSIMDDGTVKRMLKFE